MTTIHQEQVSCAVCGSAQMVMELGSTNAFGAMDLDTRPPEMRNQSPVAANGGAPSRTGGVCLPVL